MAGHTLFGGTVTLSLAERRRQWSSILVVVAAVMACLVPGTAVAETGETDRVTVVGISGLLWTDLDPEVTPHLWTMIGQSGAASMAVRAAGVKTCPDDAWVSIGAGNRGRSNFPTGQVCPLGSLIGPPVKHADGTWWMAGQTLLDASNSQMSYRTTPGLMADLVGCAAAIGPGAAVAAAHPDGHVDFYRDNLPANADDAAGFAADCQVTVIDPQTPLYGLDGSLDRRAAAEAADTAVGRILDLFGDTTILLAGISDATVPANLHPALLRSDEYARTWLTSPATRRPGYVQLADVGPTVVALAGGDVETSAMTGEPIKIAEPRGGGTNTVVTTGVNANLRGQQIPPMSDGFYATLTVLGLVMVATALVLGRRRDPYRTNRFGVVLVPIALTFASIPVASLLVNAAPWWKTGNPAVTLWMVMVGVAVALGLVAALGPWRRHPLGPPAVVAVVTTVVLAVDTITGTRLQFNSLSGYSAITGARFTGMGNYAFGVFAGAAIITGLYLTVRLRGWARTGIITAIAAAAVLIDGFPSWGNDVGGVIALTPAFILAGFHAAGKRLSIRRILVAVVAGAVAISTLMVVDYLRPPDQRTHLGRFVAEILDGSATDTLMRKAFAALQTVTAGPLTLLVIAACVAVPLLWRTRLVRSILAHFPVMLSAGIGVTCVCLLGFAFNDSGIAVPAFTLAVVVPLFVATAAVHRVDGGSAAAPVDRTSTAELVQ